MVSVRAIYDGKKLNFLEKVDVKSPKEVIVTFLDETDSDITSDELHYLTSKGEALDFLNKEKENIYSEKDLKKKYKKMKRGAINYRDCSTIKPFRRIPT